MNTELFETEEFKQLVTKYWGHKPFDSYYVDCVGHYKVYLSNDYFDSLVFRQNDKGWWELTNAPDDRSSNEFIEAFNKYQQEFNSQQPPFKLVLNGGVIFYGLLGLIVLGAWLL